MDALNNSQKRCVLSILTEVDHCLAKAEALIHAQPSAFHNLQNDVAPAEGRELRAFMQTLRNHMLNIKRTFDLQNPRLLDSARWSIRTNLEFAVVELLELTQSKLCGYGPLNEQTFQILKAQIDKMRYMLEQQIASFPQTSGDGDKQ
jgi:hypothetical protein